MHFYTKFKASVQDYEFAVMIATHRNRTIALFVTKMHELPTFVLQIDSKNTLKLIPLDTKLFLALLILLPKVVIIALLVYAKVIYPMQS